MADPVTISATIASWLTPSSLFLFINLVIGIIFISSRFAAPNNPSDHHHHGGDGHHPHLLRRSSSLLERFRSLHFYKHDAAAFPETDHPLVRTPSLVDRVRSFNFGLHNHASEPAGPETEHARPDEPELVRAPSLVDRFRAFNFGLHNHVSEPAGPDAGFVRPDDPAENLNEPELVRTPSLGDRVRSFKRGFYDHFSEPAGPEAEEVQPDEPVRNPDKPKLVWTPSLLERLWSVKLSSVYRSESMERSGEVIEGECDERNLVRRSKSEKNKGTAEMSPPEKMMRKSESEKVTRGGCSETASFGEDETVDAKADDFINRFRQQLKLQRLNSFLRYKEMVAAN